MKDERRARAIGRLVTPALVWAGGALAAILLVEYNAPTGLAVAIAAGLILGILLWR